MSRSWALDRWASTELRLLIRPRVTFGELAVDPAEGPRRLAARIGLQLLVLACAVSLTTAGRLVPLHLLFGVVAWAFIPGIQLIGASFGILVAGSGRDLRRLLSIYAAGNGPWLLFFTVVPAIAVHAPAATVALGIGRGVIPIGILLTQAVGFWLTWTFHRTVLGLSRGRAALATFVDLVAKVLLSLGWFHGMDNLVPEFLGANRP